MITRIENKGAPLGDVRSVEKKLVDLWRQLGREEQPTMRARVMTLVIVSELANEAAMAEVMMTLAARHPARHLLLLLDEGADELEADVTLLCQNEGTRLCAEQVHVVARGAAIERLPAAVRALVVPDLPVVLWWDLSPTDERIALADTLAEMADYTFFDSSLLCEVEPLARLDRRWIDASRRDLAWARLTAWREFIARQFDDPTTRPCLDQIEKVEIRTGRCPTHGWLILGWLASSLGWKAREWEGNEVRFDRADGAEVIATVTGNSTKERMKALTLSGPSFSLALNRSRTGRGTVLLTQGERKQRESFMLDDEEDVISLSREIDNMQHGTAYSEAMAVLHRVVKR